MHKTSISVNVTNTYHSGYRHLNEQRDIGGFKCLGGRKTSKNAYSFTAVAPKGTLRHDAVKGLNQEFSTQCRHDYDCCGCTSTYAFTKVTKKGQYFVTIRYSIND